MQVLQHLFLLREHINAINFPKLYCMGRGVLGSCEQQASLFLLVSELGDKKVPWVVHREGRNLFLSFSFPSSTNKQ